MKSEIRSSKEIVRLFPDERGFDPHNDKDAERVVIRWLDYMINEQGYTEREAI